jgi:sugar lactone lactonase YvrE
MRYRFLCCLLAGLSLGTAQAQSKKLVKLWETDSTLAVPESVLYDPSAKLLYVSNIDGKSDATDGSGFISTVSLDGQIKNLHWASGLNAPKGLALHRNRLYVTDLNRLVLINTKTGQAEKTWDSVDGKDAFLNDVTVADDGTVYVSDSRRDKIYRLKDDNWAVWMDGPLLGLPNGLLAVGNDKLLIGSTKTGELRSVDVNTKVITTIAEGMDRTDGIVTDGQGGYLVSDWTGQVFLVNGTTKTQLLDTRTAKVNAADITYIPAQRLLLVPTFAKNRLVAYRLE